MTPLVWRGAGAGGGRLLCMHTQRCAHCEARHAPHTPSSHEMLRLVYSQEVAQLVRMIQGDINPSKLVTQTVTTLPSLSRQIMLQWSDRVLTG